MVFWIDQDFQDQDRLYFDVDCVLETGFVCTFWSGAWPPDETNDFNTDLQQAHIILHEFSGNYAKNFNYLLISMTWTQPRTRTNGGFDIG